MDVAKAETVKTEPNSIPFQSTFAPEENNTVIEKQVAAEPAVGHSDAAEVEEDPFV